MHVNLWIPHCGSKTIEFLHLFHRQQYIPASTVYQIKLMSCPLVKKRDGGDLLARRAPPTNWASTSVDRRLRRHNNHLALTSPQKSMHLPNIMIFICTLYSEKNHPVFGPKIHFVPKSVCCVFRLFGKNQKSCLCKRSQAEMHKAADTSVLFFPRRC